MVALDFYADLGSLRGYLISDILAQEALSHRCDGASSCLQMGADLDFKKDRKKRRNLLRHFVGVLS